MVVLVVSGIRNILHARTHVHIALFILCASLATVIFVVVLIVCIALGFAICVRVLEMLVLV